jgi:hypothetical protein
LRVPRSQVVTAGLRVPRSQVVTAGLRVPRSQVMITGLIIPRSQDVTCRIRNFTITPLLILSQSSFMITCPFTLCRIIFGANIMPIEYLIRVHNIFRNCMDHLSRAYDLKA